MQAGMEIYMLVNMLVLEIKYQYKVRGQLKDNLCYPISITMQQNYSMT